MLWELFYQCWNIQVIVSSQHIVTIYVTYITRPVIALKGIKGDWILNVINPTTTSIPWERSFVLFDSFTGFSGISWSSGSLDRMSDRIISLDQRIKQIGGTDRLSRAVYITCQNSVLQILEYSSEVCYHPRNCNIFCKVILNKFRCYLPLFRVEYHARFMMLRLRLHKQGSK